MIVLFFDLSMSFFSVVLSFLVLHIQTMLTMLSWHNECSHINAKFLDLMIVQRVLLLLKLCVIA